MGPRQQLKQKQFLEEAQQELEKEGSALKECKIHIEGCNKRKRSQSFSIVPKVLGKDIANETITFWSENKHKRCSQVPREDSNGGW